MSSPWVDKNDKNEIKKQVIYLYVCYPLMKQKKRGEEKKKFKTKKIQKKKLLNFPAFFFLAFFQSADED